MVAQSRSRLSTKPLGKTPKPTKIIALPPTHDWEELAALEAQGHEVWWPGKGSCRMCVTAARGGDCTCPPPFMWKEADIIIGPTCFLMDEQHRKYLSLALAEARRRRYPKEKAE